MEGKSGVLVTGASKGIGEACVGRLIRGGFRVFAGVRNEADAERLRNEFGEHVRPLALDVTDSAQIEAVATAIAADARLSRLAGVVNNAGIAVAGPLEYLPIDRLREQLEVNVIGQVAVTQAMMPLLRRSRGRIVIIGSISGRSAMPMTGAYAASKHAMEAVADAWRVELRPWGIDVAMVEPGVIATPIWRTSLSAASRLPESVAAKIEEHYGEITRALRKRAQSADAGERGLPPDAVARVVEHALTAKRPKTRYVVGSDAKLRLLALRMLPDRTRDAVISRQLRKLARAD